MDANLAAHARRDLYALCARLFAAEVDLDLYRRLVSVETDAVLAGTGVVLIDSRVRALPEETAVDEIAAEYCRLFVGPQPACPPYESVWRGEALLGGKARRRMEALMARYGFEVSSDLRAASPDHIAVVLAFLAYLHDAAADDGGEREVSPMTIADELLSGSLLGWAPAFLDRVNTLARHALYATCARLTLALLEEERERHAPPTPTRVRERP